MKELKLLSHLMENVIRITYKCREDVLSGHYETIEDNFETRGKMIDIISTIQENLHATPSAKDSDIINLFNNQLNQLIEEIKIIDHEILINLQKEKAKTQIQIAKTFKNKENFKGYNLNSIK